MKKIFLISLIAINFTAAQVDTTDWFPMQTGNYWEYMAWTGDGPKYFSVKVMGDTLMPNGKEYKIFYKKYFDTSSDFTWYFRKDTNKILSYYGDSIACNNREYIYLDFIIPDSSIWNICQDVYGGSRGIAFTFNDNTYYNFLNKSNEAKQFEDVEITSTDTIWTSFLSLGPIVLNKGLGVVWYFLYSDGSYYLQGAIINGIKMGVITDITKEDNSIPISFSLQSYPNPFNSTTNFKINLPESDFIELSVYNILGQKVATILDEYRTAGSYSVQFSANNLSSGVYLAVLKQNKFILKEKIILLK